MTSGSDTLHGRCILVTGGARRVGAAIVRELAEAGADVVIHCRQSQREAEALATWVRGRTRSAWVVSGDLADSSALDPLMDHVLALTNGRLDGLVNNASSYPASRVRTLQANDLAASVHLHGFA
ncbi:MAG: SDR family NAD(P)-dependent oxidoreductase, partial [Rhodospirillales bacterium]|nr:SDR family NAD(P)-dependent oxidoreductase [Rhodospirillales bacterium]